jgi:hypothetical protein
VYCLIKTDGSPLQSPPFLQALRHGNVRI